MNKLSFFLISLLLGAPCTAAIITINWDGSGDYLTIQEGINAAGPNDTVIVEPGWYFGAGNRDLDFVGKAITVRSTDPNDPYIVDNTGIDCGGAARGFIFASGEGPNSVVSGFTIQQGSADNGAAIYCNGSSPTISHCVIWFNYASGNGGGIYLNNSNAHISDCGIYLNTAVSGGGGIYCNGGSPTISYCIIGYSGENSAQNGGGIYLNYSNATVSHCTVYGDTATNGSGGGIYCYGTGNPKINNCTIQNNTAVPYYGGGIFCRESSPIVSNSIVRSNWCKGQHSIVIGSPEGGGGGICCWSCDAEIVNCTVVDNETNGSAGGVYCYWDGEVTVSNSIIWDNSALEYGPEIGVGRGPSSDPALMTISYSDVKGGQGNAYIDELATLNWGLGNIDTDPRFVDAYDDCHLKSQADGYGVTSLCIDAGNPGCPLGDEPNDANNVRINIGAYGGTAEASKTPADWGILADLTNDRIVDFNDLAGFVDYWLDSGECIPGDLNRNQSVDFCDFAKFAKCWLTGVE